MGLHKSAWAVEDSASKSVIAFVKCFKDIDVVLLDHKPLPSMKNGSHEHREKRALRGKQKRYVHFCRQLLVKS